MEIFGFNFMMPTQASNAIVLDGSIIIVIGFIALAYLLFKYRKQLFDIDKDAYPQIIASKTSNNIQNNNYDQNINYATHNINVENENNIQEEIEEYEENIQKEVNLNYR